MGSGKSLILTWTFDILRSHPEIPIVIVALIERSVCFSDCQGNLRESWRCMYVVGTIEDEPLDKIHEGEFQLLILALNCQSPM